MECCLADLRKICMEKLVDRALAELRHVFCFTSIANEFQKEKVRLEPEIKTLEQLATVAAGRGNDIKANVHSWKEKADKLIQEDIQTKQTCFFGLCPDCIWRYKKGKELANNLEEIKRLIAEKPENIELPRRLPDVERYSSKDYIPLQSRESKHEELLDALKDENNYMIGLHGMGGIGKTTLAKEVGKALKLSEQFSRVIFTTVSFTPDTKKIQDEIAGPLGLEWENCNDSNRPEKLWSRLTNGEKVLLIMDDVWDQGPSLDFDLIGIPKQDNHKGCRVLITTRSKRILNKMCCNKMIELELLSEEEAWTMFKTYAGIENSSSKDVITKGRKISKECKQLPVAIALVASSLRGQQDRKHEWDATLKSLKKPVPMDGVDDEMVGVYKCLKFSYDCMKNEQAKELFLLSSVFPEDAEITSEVLTRLGIGMGLFGEDYGSYDDARNQVIVAKNKLIDSSLLMGVDEEQVKMHDLVREVAQWIANKEIQCVNLSNKDKKSSLETEINIKYLFCKGKDMDLFSCKYDGSKLKILIVVVEEDENLKCMEVPNSFFENIGKLQVLWLFSGQDKRPLSLPDSIHSLANIRSILFHGVDLGDISVLGNLQTLETLDLIQCTIDELPPGIAKLGRFKLLKLEDCKIRRNDPFEVIERCSTLEELYFIDSFNDFCRKITLPKLQRYIIRKGVSLIDDSLSKYVCFEAEDDDECFFSKETFKYCMQTSEGLELDSIKEGWRNLMPEIVPVDQGMKDLVELHLSSISQLQCLVDTTGSQVPIVLSKLKKLYLYGMENLEELFNGSISFRSLKNLKRLNIRECKMFQRLFNCELNLCNLKSVTLKKCPMLVNLFPLFTSRSLVLLEELKICDCEGLENIVIDDGGNDDKSDGPMFPKLRDLYVAGCHRLESIFPFLSLQDFPVLKVMEIRKCKEMKYIFGQYQHVELSSLKEIVLGDLPYMMCLQNLTKVKIFGCEILEIVFSNSISTCLSQLTCLIIEECKELKHIIEDDTSNSLSSRTCFPKLQALVVIKCHKLKCVFPISICKEFPELEALMISEADGLEEIFKSKNDQKVEIPNLNIVAFINLPSLFHTQRILFQAAKNRFVQNCQKLSLTSASTHVLWHTGMDYQIFKLLSSLFDQLEDETKGNDTGNENPSTKTTKDIDVGCEIEVEAALGNKLTFSQLQMKQTIKAGNEFVENASDLETPSVAILPTNTKKLENEQLISQQGLINQQDPLGEIDTTLRLSQYVKEMHNQSIQEDYMSEKTGATTKYSISKIRNEPPIQSVSPKLKEVEKGMALTNDKTIAASTHLELVSSSQMSKQDVDVRDSLETAKFNDDQDFQTREHFESPFQQLEDETKGYDLRNENQSSKTTKDIAVGVEIEVEAALRHRLTSSQELEKEQQTSHQGLKNQQDPLREIDNTVKPSQCLKETNYQSIKEGYSFKTTSSETMCSVSNIRNEQHIQLVPKLKGVEEGTALTNAKTITTSTLSKSVSSSQVQDIGVRDSLETTKINNDQVSLNEDVVMKERPIIEEQFSKGDEFTVFKSKSSPSNSVPMPLAFQVPSMHFEGNPSQKVEDLSSPYHITRKLEELVSKKHLDYENLSLLTDFLVKHPSVLLSDKLSNAYKGYAYKFLTKLLKFLQTHSVLDVLGSSHSEFVELIHDVRSFSFDKDWLDGVEKRALFPDLKFSQEALQNLLDSKKQITEDVEVVRFKIDILTQNVEELKQKLSSSEADLESIIQKEKEIVESKAALSAPLGY